MKEKIVYYPNSSTDPYYNMAFEEYLFQTRTDEEILLFWKNKPAVVCGNYQNIYAEIDIMKAIKEKVSIVRRASGGGTVYHDEGNLNYSWMRTCEPSKIQYEVYIEPIVRGLNKIGIPAGMNRKCDIAIEGKKVSGSAQKLSGNRVLHHGTLLYQTDLTKLRQIANGARADYESKGTPSVPWPVTNMEGYLPEKTYSMEAFTAALKDAVFEEYDVQVKTLEPSEEQKVQELMREKYFTWKWIYGKSPFFTCKRRVTIDGECVQLRFSARHGVLEEVVFDTDKKENTSEWKQIADVLTGRKLEIEELKKLVEDFFGTSSARKDLWKVFF